MTSDELNSKLKETDSAIQEWKDYLQKQEVEGKKRAQELQKEADHDTRQLRAQVAKELNQSYRAKLTKERKIAKLEEIALTKDEINDRRSLATTIGAKWQELSKISEDLPKNLLQMFHLGFTAQERIAKQKLSLASLYVKAVFPIVNAIFSNTESQRQFYELQKGKISHFKDDEDLKVETVLGADLIEKQLDSTRKLQKPLRETASPYIEFALSILDQNKQRTHYSRFLDLQNKATELLQQLDNDFREQEEALHIATTSDPTTSFRKALSEEELEKYNASLEQERAKLKEKARKKQEEGNQEGSASRQQQEVAREFHNLLHVPSAIPKKASFSTLQSEFQSTTPDWTTGELLTLPWHSQPGSASTSRRPSAAGIIEGSSPSSPIPPVPRRPSAVSTTLSSGSASSTLEQQRSRPILDPSKSHSPKLG